MIGSRGPTLHGGPSLPRYPGVVSGFVFKLIRESLGFTQAHLAARLGMDIASVQGWESGRRPLAALRTVDLLRLRFRLLHWGARPTLLDTLQDAIQADLIITDIAQPGEANGHPLGAVVHQCRLSSLITWPLTGIVPTPVRHLATVPVRRRGPVPTQPTLTERERAGFFDHLHVIADTHHHDNNPLARRQAIYLLGFDTRSTTAEWLRAKQLYALQHAKRHDSVPSWIIVRSSAVALAYGVTATPCGPTSTTHWLPTRQTKSTSTTGLIGWARSTPPKSMTSSCTRLTHVVGAEFDC
jgi:transcriptional regulator with XRE-family HTH domain